MEKTELDRPMYTAIKNNKLYAVLRRPFKNSTDSGVVSFDIAKNGKLENQSMIFPTKGAVGCHLCVCEEKIYVTNYTSGSVILLPDKLVIHHGCSINTNRQASAHPHFVTVSPDDKYILVTDLGMDKIITYDKELNPVCAINTKHGNGPRHLTFSEDGRYLFCVNELSSTVTMYKYKDGRLSFLDEQSTLPKSFSGESTAAAIKCIKNKVYASNRGHDSIACFEIADETLKLCKIVSCGGKSPRDFEIIGNYIICTNEADNTITVLDCNYEISYSAEAESPLCVSYIQNEFI